MKYLLSLSFAAMAFTSAIAQHQNPAKAKSMHREFVEGILRQQAAVTAGKTTAIKKRVIAESGSLVMPGGNFLFDSTRYTYTGGKGSKFDYNFMYFNNDIPAKDLASDIFSIGRADIHADSVISWSKDNEAGSLDLKRVDGHFFTNNMAVNAERFVYAGSSVEQGTRLLSSFNGQNKVTAGLELMWNGGSWDTLRKRTVTYDGSGRAVNDTLSYYDGGSWDLDQVNVYQYDGAGNLTEYTTYGYIGTVWDDIFTYVQTYTASNKLETSTFYFNGATSALEPFYKDSMSYVAGADFQVRLQTFEWNDTIDAWENNMLITKHLNAQTLPDTVYYNIWDRDADEWYGRDFVVYSYDAELDPVMAQTYIDAGNGQMVYDYVNHYYYQTYDDGTTGIKPVIALKDMKIYPNPAGDHINILWKDAANTNVNLTLMNASGQVVQTESFTWKQQAETVSIASLKPGIYWLSITDNKGIQLYRQAVVKQ